ncbi:MAG: PHP domain-containing protein, partial [Alistipes sp.]|nr:PHP domain-containing protein [Alistipes sp.]
LRMESPRTLNRKEFHAPGVDGYNAYKVDLHNHTIFSDGHLSMQSRVREAWADGLDAIAVTEHLEYRPHEKDYVKYLKGYTGNGAKAKAYDFVSKPGPAKEDIMVDFNYPVELARKTAKNYDMTIISGIEVTRKPDEYCHFNALFTTDNNAIYDADPMQSLRNAKAQGALVLHNHPGWLRKDLSMTKFEKAAYKEGLIDGIELMNGAEFYPKAITRAWKYNFFVSSNTDIHHPSAERYQRYGERRNMTLIFAKDKSVESLREAIEARRTLAYSYGTLAGEESLLRKFFEASVQVREISVDKKGRRQIIVTNKSSIDWWLVREGRKAELLEANSSIILGERTSTSNTFTLMNTWCGEDKHITVELFK